MNKLSRPFSPLASLLVLTSLLAPLPAAAAKPRKTSAPATTSSVARVTTEIIALPLNPVLPAGQRQCSSKTPFGLGYTVLRPATGAKPGEADFVLVNYIGYLAKTGAVFDQGMNASFPVGGVIPGFSKGLQMMAKTGITRFCIPAAMGYGPQASGPIPANADLVFQVELVDYKSAAEIESMRNAGQAEPANSTNPAVPPK